MTNKKLLIGGQPYSVSELIGKGGEGEIYAIRDSSTIAVKIYKNDLRTMREEKVRAMVNQALYRKTNLVAFPRAIVTDHYKNFIGFSMQRVTGCLELHQIDSPKSRLRNFPEADFRFIIQTALNLARAVGTVHSTGCVIGDLNQRGVLVAHNATISLIDADSFQFSPDGKTYNCVVGVPEFTPPELHGKNLRHVHRTIAHDNFGLAVAIFRLLFMGRHPYMGCYSGPEISLGQAIAQNRFAYSIHRKKATETTPPPGALTLNVFPEICIQSFENSFGLNPSARPNATQWIRALAVLASSLNRCSRVKTHYYPSDSGECLWCKLASVNGFDMFPDHTATDSYIRSDVQRTKNAISQILAFHFPMAKDLLPSVAAAKTASMRLRDARSAKLGSAFMGMLMMIGAITGLLFAVSAWFIWIAIAIWGWTIFSGREISLVIFQNAYKDADQKVYQQLKALIIRHNITDFIKLKSDLETAIATYQKIDDLLAKELELMRSNHRTRQKQAFLDKFPVRDANITGIGPARTATLISFGIETAGDVTASAISNIPGFGTSLTADLLAWRTSIERRFQYNSTPSAQDAAYEKTIRARFATKKVNLESTICNGLNSLNSAKHHIATFPALASRDNTLMSALNFRAQAEYDLRELGADIPPSVLAINIMSFFPQP